MGVNTSYSLRITSKRVVVGDGMSLHEVVRVLESAFCPLSWRTATAFGPLSRSDL